VSDPAANTERKQGLVDLLTRIGDTRLQFQNLDQCMVNAQSTRGGMHVTFATSVVTPTEMMLGQDEHMALIVWVKRADVQAAREAFKTEVPSA
jgi:hypothetical protein